MSDNPANLAAEIGQLIAKARQLTTHAQAIIDLGASPEAMAVIFESVLRTGNAEVNQVVREAVDSAILREENVAQAVESVVSQAIDDGRISSVTESQLQQAIQNASSIGGVALEKFLTTDDRIDLGEVS